jgi:quercetin dioxygenase-like cupin family protein
MSSSRTIVTHAKNAPAYWQIGNLWRTMATGQQTNNVFTLLDQIVADGGGGGPCTHTHTQDEGLYVISGECIFNAGGTDGMHAPAGTFVAVPRLTEHSFTVEKPRTHLLNFYLPAGFEMLLVGIAYPAERNEPPPPNVPLPPAHLVRKLAEDYGMDEVLGMPFIDKAYPGIMSTRPTPGATIFPFTSNAKSVPKYWYQGGLVSVLAAGAKTGNSYSFFERILPKGSSTRPYALEAKDEMFYILDGSVTFLLGDYIETAEQGALVYIPKGIVHGYKVNSETALVLHLQTPGGFEDVLPVLGKEATEHALPSKEVVAELGKVNAKLEKKILGMAGWKYMAVSDPL